MRCWSIFLVTDEKLSHFSNWLRSSAVHCAISMSKTIERFNFLPSRHYCISRVNEKKRCGIVAQSSVNCQSEIALRWKIKIEFHFKCLQLFFVSSAQQEKKLFCDEKKWKIASNWRSANYRRFLIFRLARATIAKGTFKWFDFLIHRFAFIRFKFDEEMELRG